MPNSNKVNKRTILVVDDKKSNVLLAEEVLQDTFDILKAFSGNEALEILNKHHKDIACMLLDLNMPDLNGRQVMEIMHGSEELKNIPVIIATSHSSPEEEVRCLEQGAVDFISKPFNKAILKSRVIKLIDFEQRTLDIKTIETDALTGVYTREAFYLHCQNFVNSQDNVFDLIVTDITDFKSINEKYGEAKADQLLKHTANFLRNNFAYKEFIGRYGSDKFILLTKKDTYPTTMCIENKIEEYEKTSCIEGARCKFAIYENINNVSSLRLCASYALTALKKIAYDYNKISIVFNDEERKIYEKKMRLTNDVIDAVKNNEFQVYYQPKHETGSGKLAGAEALIRWKHPKYGFVPPSEFIPIYESNGFVMQADFFVWQKTCQNIRKWLDKGIRVVPISVNASKLDFEYKNYIEKVMQPVKENNIDPSYLHIEVTETIEQKNVNELIDKLNICREKGFKIELDDFGSGYSSLNILGLLPLDVVKIDQSFIKQIDNPRKARILSSCIALSKNLGLVSICEGVENSEQLNILRAFGCDQVQGYYFSKPLSEEEFEKYMIEESKKNIIQECEEDDNDTLAYCIDQDFNLVSYNNTASKISEEVKKGNKCYKAIRNREAPCPLCPITNKQKGPRTIVDMRHDRFLILDSSKYQLENGEDGYLVTVSYTKTVI